MNPEIQLEVKTLESALAPIAPSKASSRIWRIVGFVVAFQIVAIVAAGLLFTALGFTDQPTCGGG
jgi:hypothetical protein